MKLKRGNKRNLIKKSGQKATMGASDLNKDECHKY
jgi:hypothetical protein